MKLDKIYDPSQLEPSIYALWEQSGSFEPRGEGEPFSIVLPPPNANGNLHVGHALINSLHDIMTRYYRMIGRDTIFIPGADHAGFETWVVYERVLDAKGKSRFDFSREQLYSQVWNFVDEQRGNMELQLRALGASCSWKHSVFTLDKKVIHTVYKTFKRLWDEGLIYRGERIVNYSTKYQTSYADIEVDHKVEKGSLWKIAYHSVDKRKEIVVSTTRPETIFGDVAVAVNPNDERYKDLIGTKVLLPLTDREIPIIADEYVDMAFGTGALKITPAHDPNDFELGNRHSLPRIQVIDFDGTMMNVPVSLQGLTVAEARKKTVAMLEASEFLRGVDEIEHSVGYDYKSGLPIEPMIKDQWFLRIQPLAQRAKQAILNGEITFSPEGKEKLLISYYDNLRDWNLSRQIPWGIPIPAFQNVDDPEDWIFDVRIDQAFVVVDGKKYRREEDTFDTWFSSGQWPFITTDYIDGSELSKYYPLSVMDTGADILPAWVSRMIMLGLYVTDKVPFKHVYLNGLVLDEKGQKMSKSKGNVVNPIETVAEFGSDALRIGLISSRSAGQNQAFGRDKIIAGRNFCNKLWNIARFIDGKLGDEFKYESPKVESLADHWIAKRLSEAAAEIGKGIETYRFAEASETMYHVVWDDVADWYVESSKSLNNPNMLAWVLETCLKIAHPFAPFVTESIWQSLSWHTSNMLITSTWPKSIEYDEIAAAEFDRLIKLVVEARYVMAELPGNDKYDMLFRSDSLIKDNAELIKKLTRVNDVVETEQARGLRLAVSGREAWLDIPAEVMYEHQANLEVRIVETHAEIKRLSDRLSNESYVQKAPAKLVEESKSLLEQKKALVVRLQSEIDVIK